MSFIQCPECGTKISDKACVCPHCGFSSSDSSRPISEQDTYEMVPTFQFEVDEWNPQKELQIATDADNKKLFQFFGKWENIVRKLPAIAQIISEMAKREKVFVADMNPYVRKLIETGVYRFSVDKNGDILPTIRDSEKIIKQVRLKEVPLTPDITGPLNNLSTQASMAQILEEIQFIGEAIQGIHVELQNDRLALAESARSKLVLAAGIQDARLRETVVANAIGTASDASRVLMRNFADNLEYVQNHSQKSFFKMLFDKTKKNVLAEKATEAFQALVAITNTVQCECEGYAMLGEYNSGRRCLQQFRQFIEDNHLQNRDTLLCLNEHTPKKEIPIVDEFLKVSNRIQQMDTRFSLNESNIYFVKESSDES